MKVSSRTRSAMVVLIIACIAIVFPPRTVSAQVLYGSIVGTVTDDTGPACPKP